MPRKFAVHVLYLVVVLVGLSGSAYAMDQKTLAEKVSLIESRPIMEVLQAQHISGEERTTAYIYEDRIEYYDTQILREIEKLGKLPAKAVEGVPLTEMFFTQFRKHPGLYIVQRGWDQDGNCHVLTTRLRIRHQGGGTQGPTAIFEMEESNTCTGDPCRKCKPYDPTNGCLCDTGVATDKCNHSITTEE